MAEAEIKHEEKQRVLGVVPDFYVSYVPDAVPLSSEQKFELAWMSTFDPFTFVFVGESQGLSRHELFSADMGKAHRLLVSATVPH